MAEEVEARDIANGFERPTAGVDGLSEEEGMQHQLEAASAVVEEL